MINLQTYVTIPQSSLRIDHNCQILMMGSCFSDAISKQMADCGFDVLGNPFGTLYNPLSIAECIKRSQSSAPLAADDIIFHNGLWHSWFHHGSFSRQDRLALLADCNNSFHRLASWLEKRGGECGEALGLDQPSIIIITFGTAYVYRHNGRVVANCHKLPASLFERSRITIDDIVAEWRPLLQQFQRDGHKVILTVSPIRHLADGAHGNQLSKATLLLAVEQLCADGLAEYFPSYEIVLDELRDYRFYADDMTHPSDLAERIVWQRFQETYMTAKTVERCQKHQKLNRLKQHRPLHTDSTEYDAYLKKVQALERELHE